MVKCCKFHAKTQIENSNYSTTHYILKFVGDNGLCEVMMGFPESKCGNPAYFVYETKGVESS